MEKFYIVGNGSDYLKIMWNDAVKLNNCCFFDWKGKNYTGVLRKIRDAQYHHKVFCHIKHCFKRIWRKMYNTKFDDISSTDKNYVIFCDFFSILYDTSYIKQLKKKNCTIVVFILNTVESIFHTKDKKYIDRIMSKLEIDYIYSFDRKDCERYGINYYPNIYSKIGTTTKGISNDALFVGANKGRIDQIKELCYFLKKHGLSTQIYVSQVLDDDIEKDSGIIYNKYIPYSEVLGLIMNSRIIIDLPMRGQEGLSLRYFEAVCYNKRLISYNKSVLETPFYNSKFMEVVDSVNDIRVDFLTDKCEVNYDYDNSYSPLIFLRKISEENK